MSTHKRDRLRKRHHRVRLKVSGTGTRPRLSVFVSNRHVYTQLIDDVEGKTLVSASTLEKDIANACNVAVAEAVGGLLGKRAVDKGIGSVVFDRGGFQYHGRVKAVAESARKAGLVF